MKHKITFSFILFIFVLSEQTQGQIPLLSKDVVGAVHGELSGEAAKRNL